MAWHCKPAILFGREKWNIRQQNSIITVRIPLGVKSGENVCDINALFGELKSPRENKLLSTERVMVWFTIKTFIFLMASCHFVIMLLYWRTLSLTAVDKTRNMDQYGTFRNIPENPGTSNNYDCPRGVLAQKTRGSTLGVSGCIRIQGQRIFVEKVRNVFVMGEAFSIWRN